MLDDVTPDALGRCLALVAKHTPIDIVEAARQAVVAAAYYNGDASLRGQMRAAQALEARWYASLEQGTPDYSVYEDSYYLSDLWACWVVYSRKYLTALRKNTVLMDMLADSRRIGDVGCGLGYTTRALKELFPLADVYGTNVPGVQTQVASEMSGCRIVSEVEPETDLVFASEYFEHFQRPIEHLRDVLRVAEPKHLVIANAFGSKSIGHFDVYLDEEDLFDPRQVPGASVGRLFNDVLRKNGYATVKTEFWNNRPAVWRRRV